MNTVLPKNCAFFLFFSIKIDIHLASVYPEFYCTLCTQYSVWGGGDVIMGTVSVADQRLDAEFSQNLESGKMEFYEKVL